MTNWTKEQELAINKEGSNIIVSAGAGSGKTAVLTERVIRKLKEGTRINELLILTFTKKAAYEMKDRIRKSILEDDSLKDNLSLLDSAYITTFDSFSLSIVKKYNYLLNISKNISVIDSSIISLLQEEYLEEIFNDLYEENNNSFNKLIDDFTIKDDRDIKEYVLNVNRKLELLYNKNEYLDNYIDNYYTEENINRLINSYMELINIRKNYINNLLTEISNYVDIDFFNKLNDSLSNLLSSNTYDEYKRNSEIKLPSLPKGSEEEAKSLKEEIKIATDDLIDLLSYEDINELKDTLISTKEYVEAIITIINRLDNKLNAYKYEKEYFEFGDISKLAIKVVKENKEVRDELKYFFKEIMIDEYQDTSDLQDIFISMIDNNNVYMVGDIKQSIYRFRNANPYLFKSKYDNYSKNIDGFKIDLTNNFRSREEVVNTVNLIFDDIMTDSFGGASYKESHEMIFGNKSYNEEGKTKEDYNLEILNYEYDKECNYTKKEIEIFTIANDIKNKVNNKYQIFDKSKKIVRDATYDDFVILLSDHSNFDLFKKIFEYLEIPLTKYSDTNLLDADEVYLVKNILKLLISYKTNTYDVDFKYSLTSVLRSYLFEYTDEEIFKMFKDNNFLDNKAMDIIKEISIDIDSLSLSEIINIIINKYNFYNKINLIGDVNKVLNRLDEIESLFNSLSNLGYDLYEAYNYIQELIDNGVGIDIKEVEESTGSVKIMTIHASKGLEFPVCYFAFLDTKFNISDLNERFIFDNKYGIITPYYKEGIGKLFTKELVKDRYLKEEVSEKIRLLYVALTRPKEKIIMVTCFNKEKSDISLARSFLDMLSLIKDNLSKYIKPIDIDKLNINRDYNLIKETNYKKSISKTSKKVTIKKYNYLIEKEETTKASKTIKKLVTLEEKEKMSKGTEIHKIFEYLDFYNPDYSNIDEYFIERIKYLLDNINLKEVINIYKEYEFTYKEENTLHRGVIDLLLEYKDKYVIIDYKLSNVEDDAYNKQLEEYKKYIENKTNKKVSTYLYSIINEEFKEIKE